MTAPENRRPLEDRLQEAKQEREQQMANERQARREADEARIRVEELIATADGQVSRFTHNHLKPFSQVVAKATGINVIGNLRRDPIGQGLPAGDGFVIRQYDEYIEMGIQFDTQSYRLFSKVACGSPVRIVHNETRPIPLSDFDEQTAAEWVREQGEEAIMAFVENTAFKRNLPR